MGKPIADDVKKDFHKWLDDVDMQGVPVITIVFEAYLQGRIDEGIEMNKLIQEAYSNGAKDVKRDWQIFKEEMNNL